MSTRLEGALGHAIAPDAGGLYFDWTKVYAQNGELVLRLVTPGEQDIDADISMIEVYGEDGIKVFTLPACSWPAVTNGTLTIDYPITATNGDEIDPLEEGTLSVRTYTS